jgi:TonB family protein
MSDHSHPRRHEFWGDLAAMSVRPNRHTALLLVLALFACNAEARAQTQSPPPVDEIGVSPPPPPTPFAIDPGKPQRPIAALTSVQPIYPRDQVCLGIDGTVTLIVAVGSDNQVLDVTVERSSRSRELDRAAIDAVRRTRWQAQIVNGVPIASRVRLPVTYVLDEQPREYCRRVEITLFDTEATAPVSARLELYVPVALEAQLQ